MPNNPEKMRRYRKAKLLQKKEFDEMARRAEDGVIHNHIVRQYLLETVMDPVLDGMRRLACEKPGEPLLFLAKILREHHAELAEKERLGAEVNHESAELGDGVNGNEENGDGGKGSEN
ncbi:Protein dpy-30 [Rhizina undulata]